MSETGTSWGDILAAFGGVGAAIATAFAAAYAKRTWKVYQKQEQHMAVANEIQRSLGALAVQAGRAERRSREASFAPNLLLKNPRGIYVDWQPEGATTEFSLRAEWEVHNLGKGPAQALEAGPATSLSADASAITFHRVPEVHGRPLEPGASCWAPVTFPPEIATLWAEFVQQSGVHFMRGLREFDYRKLSQYTGARPAIFVRCSDVFGTESIFGADLEGNMRLVNTPFGGDP